jgi:predicted nucleic acid-binding protein
MILVDTSIIVAWLDPAHPDHERCARALDNCAAVDELAVSSVTFAELAAGGRTREALDEDLTGFVRLDLDFDSAFLAGQAYRKLRAPKKGPKPVLPDFLIRGQSAHLNLPHLTNDRGHLKAFPEIDFLFPTG